MKKINNCLIVLLAITCLILFFYARNSFELDIVKDGKPVARIVIPDNADRYTKNAAQWIQQYVKAGTGAELPILSESKDAGAGPRICVGATKAAGDAGIRGDSIKWDGCRLVVKGDMLFLIGHDEQGPTDKPYLAPKGTCRAAVTFLEDFCGVRWLIPTPLGELVPQRKDISVPSDFDRTVVPAFGYAAGRWPYGLETPAAYANNFRIALRLYTGGGHTWPKWVPLAKYYKDHPEYFALIKGRRSDNKQNHLCTTNPDVKRLLLENLHQKFDEGYDWVALGQSDGYQRCECPACEAMDNYRDARGKEPCERILVLHRDIAEECLKSHPDKKVHILIYGPTGPPSKKFDKFPDNVVLEICDDDGPPVSCAKWQRWQGKANAFTAYVYFWGTYWAPGLGPKFTAAQVADFLRFLRDNHVQGIYFCGAGECWGLEGHAYYACGKLLGNPDLDPKELVKEYCDGVFGKAAPAMLQFFEALDKRVQLFQELRREFGVIKPEDVYTTSYPPETLDQLESLLRQAEKLADDERSRIWVGLSRITFDYVKLTANAYTLYRAFKVNKNRANLAQLRKVVEEWRAHGDRIMSLSKPEIQRWFPGYDAWREFFSSSKRGGHLPEAFRAPFEFDFEKMMTGCAESDTAK